VKTKISQKHYKIVAVVHAETSTGVKNPVEEIGALLKGTDTIYLVDAVTSLGGIEIEMDAWGIDALYSGTQKCLSCPPGLAPLSFSEKAVAALETRKTKVPNWYLDLSMIMKYWKGATRAYHHTAPINMHYGLYQALQLILEEGLDHVYQRHLQHHHDLVSGLDEMGLSMLVTPGRPAAHAQCGQRSGTVSTRPLSAAPCSSNTKSRSGPDWGHWPEKYGESD
jgi:alanine-glyoxylate transaminase/serine-glyoxylate transaminase/serine-pyruvate transaminase